jgi:hypothetical protein
MAAEMKAIDHAMKALQISAKSQTVGLPDNPCSGVDGA